MFSAEQRPGDRGAGVLPAPTGPLPVGTHACHLVDDQRTDRDTAAPRELMIRLWYPTDRAQQDPAFCPSDSTGGRHTAAYLTPGVARLTEARFSLPSGTLGCVRTHSLTETPPRADVPDLPLLLFGGGRQDPAELSTTLAVELASHGYLVVGVNHTHDGPVEFPDGRIVPGGPTTRDPQELRDYTELRAADLSFVLDVLEGERGAHPLQALRHASRPVRAGVFGHSMGGSAAAAAVLADQRFVAGASIDGMLFGSPVTAGLDRPFLLLTEAISMPSWSAFMNAHRGWGRRVEVPGAGHYSFTDLAPLVAATELGRLWPKQQHTRFFGDLDPQLATSLTADWIRRFFGRWIADSRPTSDERAAYGSDLTDGGPHTHVTWRTDRSAQTIANVP